MARVYVGNLSDRATEGELEDEFKKYGKIHYVWVARKPPGFAFLDFESVRDAEDAVRAFEGNEKGWRVEISKKSYGQRAGERDREKYYRSSSGPRGGGGGGGGRDMACYNCGEVGHLARDCRAMGRPASRRSPPPRRYDSPPRRRYDSPPRRRDYSPRRSLSRSPRRDSRSPRRRDSRSPVRDRSRSRSR